MAKKTSTVQPSTSNLQPVAASAADAATIATAIRQQVALVGEIELRGNFEKLKLGAMVSEAVKRLQLEDLAANRGRNSVGGGALGWWNDVCPKNDAGETVIKYKTVMMWKAAAENLPKLMGLGLMKADKMLALLAENPEEAVGKDAKILASAEKAANGMTMRQMLLWGGDEPKGKPGRPVGSVSQYNKPDTNDPATCARAEWSRVIVPATNTTVLGAAAKLLKLQDVEDALVALKVLIDFLTWREKELKR